MPLWNRVSGSFVNLLQFSFKTNKQDFSLHSHTNLIIGSQDYYIMNCVMKLLSQQKNKCLHMNTIKSIRESKTTLTIDDMPHPKSLPIIGTKLELLLSGSGKMLHKYIDNRHKTLGPIFYEILGGSTKLVFIDNPTLMKSLFLNLEGKYPTHLLPEPWILYEKLYGNKRGLFFMSGEEWLSNRRAVNKHLLRDDSDKWMMIPVQNTVEMLIENWKIKSKNDCFVPDLESEFYRFSTDVIISILLGNNVSLNTSKHSDMLLNMFSESVKRIFQTTTNLYGLPVEWCQRLNMKCWRDFKESVDISVSLAQKIVAEMLHRRGENNGLIKKLCEENLSDETITKIVADFVIAAGDTTAYTSLWILYLLSNHKEVMKDIREKDQRYVKNVIKESMRLYPVAPFLTRILPKQSVLERYTLKEGTPIIASIYTSGRNEQNFSQADKFLPYRWDRNHPSRKELENHVPSASLPFALGARSCIGRKIAMLQITEMIYQIANHFDLECLNKTEVEPITSQVLVPSDNIKIAVSLRK